MLNIRPSQERGIADHGWLRSKHSFSFASYYDPQQMGFRCLRVINEDIVQPSKGFGSHGHRDMEIISYVITGELEHKDSMGNGSIIRPGEVQYMSAGTGVRHSEYNASTEHPVHFLQIWILPDAQNHPPSYGQHDFSAEKQNQLKLVVDGKGEENALQINQDIKLYASCLDKSLRITHRFQPGRYGWIQVVKGEILISSESESLTLVSGDGLAISQEELLHIQANTPAEFLLFDLP